MIETIPIFPLNTVLFPGAPLPLRIFEPRYREMLARCLADERRFGVTLIRSGEEVGETAHPFMVGTVARIVRVREEDRGAIPIDTRGERRFRISKLDNSQSYLVGEVEFLEDQVDDEAEAAAEEARLAAVRYIRTLLTVQGEWRRELELPQDPLRLSYFLGTVLLGLPGTVRQTILEADPVSNRLRLAARAVGEAAVELETTLMRSGPGRDRSVFGLN